MNWKGVLQGTAWTLAGSVIQRLAMILTSIIVARMLGPKGLGELGLIRNFGVIAVPLFTLGLSKPITRAISHANRPGASAEEMAGLLSTVFAFTVISAAFAPVILSLGSGPIADFYKLPSFEGLFRLMAILFIISIPYEITVAVLAGLEKFRALALRQIIFTFLAPLVIYLCIKSWGVAGAIIASGIVNFIVLVVLLRQIIFKIWSIKISPCRPSLITLKSLFKIGLPILGSIILLRPINLIGSSILLLYASLTELGWFRVAYAAYGLIMVLPGALESPLLSLLSKSGGVSDIRKHGITLARLFLIFGMPFCVFGIIVAGPLTVILFGKAYIGAENVVTLMIINGYFAIIVVTFETNIISQGKTTTQLGINIVNLLVFVTSALTLVPIFAHIGLALSYLITEFFAFCFYAYLFLKHSNAEVRELLKPLVASGGTIALTYFFFHGTFIQHQSLISYCVPPLIAVAVMYISMSCQEREKIRRLIRPKQIKQLWTGALIGVQHFLRR